MTSANAKRRERIQPRVPSELRQRLTRYCAAQGITETACVAAAITEYLDQTSHRILIMRRLDRLGRALARLQRDQEIALETFGCWIHVWFAHTPALPDEAKRVAATHAKARFDKFVEHVSARLSNGRRFIDDLPKDTFASSSDQPSEDA